MKKLNGKVAIVTGASRGIGRGIAKALSDQGCNLVLTARGASALQQAAQEISAAGVETLALSVDVTDEVQIDQLFAATMERFGRIDILVNNAGAFDSGALDQLTVEAWDRVINTNLRAPFLCTRAAMRIMKAQGGGRIINIGSISALKVRPNTSPYCASKHGLWGLTQSTALEGRDHGITCCCLHPGNVFVERRVGSEVSAGQEPMMSVDEISEVALLMATLPPHVEMLEAIVLPHQQPFVGRG